ncbi:uncharacterized protein BJ212DRAFT_1479142 [Suillus subaureus]|uniref:DUF6532 domain-containing protein n=1 Tax=Suillus subaureus TaxID=48587 RepID=A0A9P7EF05_9AGAM|nr:uncharacterized protein BJ212DRAFT_1479142 [Suillus subaureus]KAG1819013.1 hypothetical protein BJ212DRAFT_1479142 [Suillus subaureus]
MVLNTAYTSPQNMKSLQHNQNIFADHACSSQPPPTATISECNIDPALCEGGDVARQGLHARLVGSDPEDSESSSSSTGTDIDKDNDKEDEDEGDKGENNKSQFGWGEAHQWQKGHPEFEFQYSHDEDDDSAWMHLNNSNQPLNTLPGVQQEQSDTQSKAKKSKGSDGPRPDQLAWYGPHWKSFLKEAKGECRRQHALENPFPPLVKEMLGTISEVLLSVLVAWDKNGRQFKAGVWPEQQYNMTQLLYDNLLTWWSDLKKTAISITPLSYPLLPPPLVPPQQCATWVENAAKDLLQGGLYLQFGIDENGRMRNFTNPALRDTSIAFFYTGPYWIAWRQPDQFRTQLPISCLALVATVFHCIFDGLEKNSSGKSYPNFSLKEYLPIYRKMLEIIKHTLQDKYFGPRLMAQLREWAEAGWAENLKLNGGAMEVRHDHLQVILD